ncbi:MAG: GntR family transcriptional regulator, partial [Ilumatobacteraceae bacterium]
MSPSIARALVEGALLFMAQRSRDVANSTRDRDTVAISMAIRTEARIRLSPHARKGGGRISRQGQPRYVEIADGLRRTLANAKAGDPVPSETEPSVQSGVSRLTARQAVKLVEAEGLVYRVAGSGTFATGGSGPHRTMGELRSFTEEMRERGIETSSVVLERGWADPDASVRADLELAEGSRAIRVCRIRLGNGTPLALETAYLHPRCSFILDFDLTAMSMHALLEARGIVPTRALGTLIAVPATASDAETLDIELGSPLLVERRPSWTSTATESR